MFWQEYSIFKESGNYRKREKQRLKSLEYTSSHNELKNYITKRMVKIEDTPNLVRKWMKCCECKTLCKTTLSKDLAVSNKIEHTMNPLTQLF